MTDVALAADFTQEGFQAFLAARNEPYWLSDLRAENWKLFSELPLPDSSQEEWRRTDIRSFRLEKFGFPRLAASSTRLSSPKSAERPAIDGAAVPAALLSAGIDLAGSAIAVDSRPYGVQLDRMLGRQGVLFGSLDKLVIDHGNLLRPYLLNPVVDPRADKFAALQAACWSGGALLWVPKGVVTDRPLHILSVLSPEAVDLGRILIVLEEGAEATVLAETASSDPAAAGLHCGAMEILVGPRGRLRLVSLQNWGMGVWHFAHQKAMVDRDASLQWTIGALGSRLAKVNQHVVMVGPGAQVQVNGVMFTEGRQHLSYHTLQRHQQPRCTSDLLYKGALQDRSRIVWRGMIKVDPDAQKTDGYQRDDNLILSENARADSIPGLEIQADDVKCSHGATAGRVDDEQVFYACARGLTRKEAVRMIVNGFFQQVFDRITIESVRHALVEAIGKRIREYE